MDKPHSIAVSEALFERLKEDLAEDIYIYRSTSSNYEDDLTYHVESFTTSADGRASIRVANDPRINIYEIEGLDKFEGSLNGYDIVSIDSIEEVNENVFIVNVSQVGESFTSGIEAIDSFGLKLSNYIFYDASFFAFPQSYRGNRISYKTFGLNVKLLITTKDDITNYAIEYLTQKIYDLFYYCNNGSTPLEIDGNVMYIKPFGNFSSIDIAQESDNINSRLVTISFSYNLRYKAPTL